MYVKGLHQDFGLNNQFYPGSTPGGEWNFLDLKVESATRKAAASDSDSRRFFLYVEERDPVLIEAERVILRYTKDIVTSTRIRQMTDDDQDYRHDGAPLLEIWMKQHPFYSQRKIESPIQAQCLAKSNSGPSNWLTKACSSNYLPATAIRQTHS